MVSIMSINLPGRAGQEGGWLSGGLEVGGRSRTGVSSLVGPAPWPVPVLTPAEVYAGAALRVHTFLPSQGGSPAPRHPAPSRRPQPHGQCSQPKLCTAAVCGRGEVDRQADEIPALGCLHSGLGEATDSCTNTYSRP